MNITEDIIFIAALGDGEIYKDLRGIPINEIE
jgi:hypothetical protein